jgi:hypothetical protein
MLFPHHVRVIEAHFVHVLGDRDVYELRKHALQLLARCPQQGIQLGLIRLERKPAQVRRRLHQLGSAAIDKRLIRHAASARRQRDARH